MRKEVGRSWGSSIINTSDPYERLISVLLWGPSGCGKTKAISTFPSPFIIATEDGLLTIAGSNIPAYIIDPKMAVYSTIMAILESARKREVVLDKDGEVMVDFSKIKTLGLDSLSKLNELLIDEIIEGNNDRPMQMQDWGTLGTRIRAINNTFLSLPYHKVATSGQAVHDDAEDESKITVGLNMQGGYKNTVMYEYDFFIYMEQEIRGTVTRYNAYSKSTNKRTAKSRADLPPKIENLTYDILNDAVSKKLGKVVA